MPFIPTANAALAELVFALNGETVENTLWFTGTTTWDATTLEGLANDLITWWDDNMKPYVSNQLQLVAVKCTDMSSSSGPTVTIAAPTNDFGAISTGEALPNNVTLSVTFRTGNRGRSFRGRNYVAGWRSSMLSATNVASATTRANFIAAYGALATDVTENGATHVVVSKYTNNAPRANGLATAVLTYTAESVLDSQRRRLPGRGD